MRAKLRVYRFDPRSHPKPRYDTFELDTDPGETVLSTLIKVYEEIDPSLGFRFACGKVKCGECSLMVNRTPCLACNRKVEPEMIIDPLPHLPLIKDLVIDRSQVIHKIVKMAPSLLESEADGAVTLESQMIDTYIKLTSCFECLICQSVCPVLQDKPDGFIGPLGLLWLAQAKLTGNDLDKGIEDVAKLCEGCGQCWDVCPSEVNFLEDAIKQTTG